MKRFLFIVVLLVSFFDIHPVQAETSEINLQYIRSYTDLSVGKQPLESAVFLAFTAPQGTVHLLHSYFAFGPDVTDVSGVALATTGESAGMCLPVGDEHNHVVFCNYTISDEHPVAITIRYRRTEQTQQGVSVNTQDAVNPSVNNNLSISLEPFRTVYLPMVTDGQLRNYSVKLPS